MHRKHPQTHRPTFIYPLIIALILLLKPQYAVLSQTSDNMTATLDSSLQIAVKDTIVALKGAVAEDAVTLFDVQSSGAWTAGSAMVYASHDGTSSTSTADEEGSPYLFPFVAYWDQAQWLVAVEYAPDYGEMLKAAPQIILSPVHLAGLVTPRSDGPSQMLDSPQLGLPWVLGETQYFTGGPHPDNSSKRLHPWSAIDFAGGSTHVRAPADGVVYLMPGCPYVQINHGNGWQTGYYHLIQIAVSNGQSITRGTLLGKQSLNTSCGGRVTGAHVHMTLRLNGQLQNWQGQALGGWRIEEGADPYAGCLIRSGLRRCAVSAIYNDGVIGEGTGAGSAPVLTATPSNTPHPTPSPFPRTATKIPLPRTPIPRTPTPIQSIPTARSTQGPILTITPNPVNLTTLPEADGVCGLTTLQLNAKLPDNSAKMSCFSIPITASGIISELAVSVAMSHTWVSDLRMQLRSPNGQMLTLLNRPGWPTNAFGFGSNLSALYPITFTQHGTYDAEQMGSLDTRRVICRDDTQCEFVPNTDQDIGSNIAGFQDLVGTLSVGNWQVCMSDLAKGDVGVVSSIGLNLHCAAAPETVTEDLCAPVSVTPDQVIPDNNADGVCVDVVVPFTGTVDSIALDLGLDHTFLGDLHARLISPDHTALTLMNRPGQPAAPYGDTSNLVSVYPVGFADDAPNDPEQMGQQLGGNGIVCRDDLRCRYRPNANSAGDGDMAARLRNLHEFAGKSSAGTWRICVSDRSAKDVGRLHQATLDLTCSAETALIATPTPLPTAATIETPAPTSTSEPVNPDGGMLKAEELDEPSLSTLWLPLLTRAGDVE